MWNSLRHKRQKHSSCSTNGTKQVADVIEAILGACLLKAGVAINTQLLQHVQSLDIPSAVWEEWHTCIERLCLITVFMHGMNERLKVDVHELLQ